MRFAKSKALNRRPRNDDDAVMPLINIVFLLLIFFMVAGKLTSSDPFEISPPSSSSGVNEDPGSLTLLVGRDGETALDGVAMSETELVKALTDRLQEEPGAILRLKADGGAKAADVIQVMEIIRDAGAGELNLLTVPDQS
ncbi:biopolymer transporter ExbD [Hwanghaeella grinnelliae]|uniref:Biopolymer transporter ExbD n=1 Tax=Hwanghaeella grinnelliae TaxID=2500179 RepID=A0A437QGW8_9PROT|nr:biopolymer transporter ExbD [Hwanghaeella grinnelliae]RVU33646.1 biopolymer transporter ExbD [Hwanghaeella grinnelliae]